MKFTYNWKLTDLKKVEKNNLKVFSCFACGGGSTMGYKMSGFDVIGCNEIDTEMMTTYKKNHNPKYSYLEDIRKFKKRNDLPKELFNLDILDGSPPCSSFSMAGSREKGWQKNKKFREGQVSQTLDDLFFDFIEVAFKLQPKVVIAENVKGMLQGNAKGYVKQIINLFKTSGYNVQLFLLNGASMGLPQRRERVFFICTRKDLNFPKLKLSFHERPIPLLEAIGSITTKGKMLNSKPAYWWKQTKPGGLFSYNGNKKSGKMNRVLSPKQPAWTLTASNCSYHWLEPRHLSKEEGALISSFPQDYIYINESSALYQMGMSVPPIMMHKISEQIYKQWFLPRGC
jgi:DNA (cytosine-5)-methyltransferase 1